MKKVFLGSILLLASTLGYAQFECEAQGYYMEVYLYSSGEFEGNLYSDGQYVYGEQDGFNNGIEFEGFIYEPGWLSGYVYCWR